MKRAGVRTRTWTVALSKAEWDLAEAVRKAYGGSFGISRADLVMIWVHRAANQLKSKHPDLLEAPLTALTNARDEGFAADSIEHGGRPPTVSLPLHEHPSTS